MRLLKRINSPSLKSQPTIVMTPQSNIETAAKIQRLQVLVTSEGEKIARKLYYSFVSSTDMSRFPAFFLMIDDVCHQFGGKPPEMEDKDKVVDAKIDGTSSDASDPLIDDGDGEGDAEDNSSEPESSDDENSDDDFEAASADAAADSNNGVDTAKLVVEEDPLATALTQGEK